MAIRESDNSPKVVALNLPSSGSPTKIWDKSLRYGSHGSDPVFVQTDDDTAYVMLTTTESTNGAMWLWKLDSSSGDPSWDGKSLGNLDGDSNVPHIRLPGPIVANLDQDSSPEIIVTIQVRMKRGIEIWSKVVVLRLMRLLFRSQYGWISRGLQSLNY